MMMLKKNLVVLILVSVLITSCQLVGSQKPSTDTLKTPETTAAYPSPVASLYPAPVYPTSQPYPDLSTYPTPQTLTVLYPDATDGDEVSWTNAVAMILNGEVTQVTQTHDLKVTLSLKDGRTLITTEESIDDVIEIIEACGEKCKDIRIATE